MKNKVVLFSVIAVVILALVGAVAYILWTNMNKSDQGQQPKKEEVVVLTAKEVKDLSVDINDILTNNADNVVKASFTFELNNLKAKEEFVLLDFKVKNAIIQTLADIDSNSLKGSKGYDNLTSILMNKVNEFLKEGKVSSISITNIVMQ